MKFYNEEIVFQEVPNEVSLAFSITGCQVRCEGCHSPQTWSACRGQDLTPEVFIEKLVQYKEYISCVLFLGGEWHQDQLLNLIQMSKKMNLKVCLYTGQTDVPQELKDQLDYIKVGPWRKDLGGLDSPKTNQKFIEIKTGQILNHYFRKALPSFV